MHRGYGVSALIDPDLVAPLARAAEDAGYRTFWVNDVPGGNGLEQLARAQAGTSRIRLGVGVMPVDRWNAEAIASEIGRLHLDPHRLALGIGAGTLQQGALIATQRVAVELKGRASTTVLIGALGPRMCRLAGLNADGVVLNWLTPSAATNLSAMTRAGANDAGRADPEIVAYVRTAADGDSRERLEREAGAYEGYPSYRRHFERMGVSALDTAVNGSHAQIDRRFAEFGSSVDELVARAITAKDTLTDYLAVLAAARPASRM